MELRMSIRSTITAQVIEVARRQKKVLAPLTDDLPLLESGLDSLCLAVLVAALEDALDLDPFGDEGAGGFPVTFGDFIELYENAAA
jgi:acyl carrier protein